MARHTRSKFPGQARSTGSGQGTPRKVGVAWRQMRRMMAAAVRGCLGVLAPAGGMDFGRLMVGVPLGRLALALAGPGRGRAAYGAAQFCPLEPRLLMTALYWDPNGAAGPGGAGTFDSGTANWNVHADGSGARQAWTPGADAIFTGTAGAVTVSGSLSANSLTFNSSGYSVSGGSLAVGTLNVATGDGAAVGTVLTGTAGLTKAGAGSLTLTGANTYSGGTVISAGSLQVGNGGTTGSLGSGAIVDNGALVYSLGAAIATIGSGGISGSGSVSITAGSINFSGNVTTGGSQSYTAMTTGTYYNGGEVAAATVTLSTTGAGSAISLTGDFGKRSSVGNNLVLDTSAGNGNINLNVSLGRSGVWYGLSSFTANAGTGAVSLAGTNPTHGWSATSCALTGALAIAANIGNAGALALHATADSSISGNLGLAQSYYGYNDLTVDSGATLSVSGQLSGVSGVAWGGFNKRGGGTLVLSNSANNYGQGAVFYGGTVAFSNGALPAHNTADTGATGYAADIEGNVTLQWASGNTQDLSASSQLKIGDGSTVTLDTNGNTLTLGTALVTGSAKTGGLTKAGNGTLTLGAANTYTGTTTVNGGKLTLTGAISANSPVVVNTGAVLSLVGGNATGNAGTSAATGSYTINGGVVSNDGAAGTTQVINGNLTLNGGALAATASANSVYGNFFFYNNSDQVVVTGTTAATISASLHLAGTHIFNVAATGAAADLLIPGQLGNQEGTAWGYLNKTGAGTLSISNNGNALGGLTVGAGTVRFQDVMSGLSNGGLIDNGAVEVNTSAGVSATGSFGISGSGSLSKTGTGTVTLSGAATYTGATTVASGRLVWANIIPASTSAAVSSGATLECNVPSGIARIGHALTFTGSGTLVKSGAGQLVFGDSTAGTITVDMGVGGLIDVQGGLLTASSYHRGLWDGNLASLNIAGGATVDSVEAGLTIDALTGAGTLKGGYSGTSTDTIGVANATSVFGGAMQNDGGTSLLAITKVGSGTLTLADAASYTGSTTVNGGTLLVDGSTATGSVVTVNNGGVLGGTGTTGTVTIAAGGTLAPGNGGIGTLTSSSATLALSGTANMEINKTTGTSDKVQGISTLTYGGTLNVTNLAGTLVAGDTFTLFAATTYAGSFATINLPALPTDLLWNTANLTTNGTISVYDIPPTVATAAAASPATVTGTTTSLSVLGADDGGEANLTYTWTATTLPSGAWAPTYSVNGTNAAQNTVATFSQAGAYTFQVTIADLGGAAVTSNVNVLVSQTVAGLTITPGTAALYQGASQDFTASATDQFGNALDLTAAGGPTVGWSLGSSPQGTLSATTGAATTYTANADGNGSDTLTVTAGAVSASAALTVAPAPSGTISEPGTAVGGATYTLQLAPQLVPQLGTLVSWAVDWGDGTAVESCDGAATVATHTFDNTSATYIINMTATDADGQNATVSQVVAVQATTPTLHSDGAAVAEPGIPYTLDLAAVYAEPATGATAQWSIDWGDGEISTAAGAATTATHQYAETTTPCTIQAAFTDDAGTYNAAALTVAVAPAAPSDVTASAQSVSCIAVHWTNEAASQTGFVIERQEDGGDYTDAGLADGTTYFDNDVTPGHTYSYKVRAIGESYAGEVTESADSDPSANVDPADVLVTGGLLCTVDSATAISLHWDLGTLDPATVPSGFVIERDAGAGPVQIATVDGTARSYTDSTVSADGSYSYSVCATGLAAVLTGAPLRPTAAGGLAAALTLQIAGTTPVEWHVDWGDTVQQVVPGGNGGSPMVSVDGVTTIVTQVTHNYASSGNYAVQATAWDSSGLAASVGYPAVELEAPVAAAPAIWIAATAADGATSGQGPMVIEAGETVSLAFHGPSEVVTGWTVNWGDTTQEVAGDPLATGHRYAAGAAGQNYTISAVATCADGTTVSANVIPIAVAPVTPADPSVTAAAAGANAITVSWTDTSGGSASFDVSVGGLGGTAVHLAPGTTSYTFNNLPNSWGGDGGGGAFRAYVFYVTIVNSNADGTLTRTSHSVGSAWTATDFATGGATPLVPGLQIESVVADGDGTPLGEKVFLWHWPTITPGDDIGLVAYQWESAFGWGPSLPEVPAGMLSGCVGGAEVGTFPGCDPSIGSEPFILPYIGEQYTARWRVASASGYSGWSDTVVSDPVAQGLPQPGLPAAALSATALSGSQIAVSWTGGTPFNEDGSHPIGPVGGVYSDPGCTIPVSNWNSTGTVVDGLAPNRTYYFQTTYTTYIGGSFAEVAATASAKTLLAAPPAPGGLHMRVASDRGGIELAWTDNATLDDSQRGFTVERSADGGQTWVALGGAEGGAGAPTVGPGVVDYEDQTAAVGTNYEYRVLANGAAAECSATDTVDADFDSPPSNVVAAAINLPLVSITADMAWGFDQPGDWGQFVITRTDPLGYQAPLTVALPTPTGSAVAGVDYQALPATVVIPAGQSTVYVPVEGITAQDNDPSGMVIETLASTSTYTVATASATVGLAGDVELKVDSLNVSAAGLPQLGSPALQAQYDAYVDKVDGDPAYPGKIVVVNDTDRGGDGTADYNDGLTGSSQTNDNVKFVPVTVEVPADIDVTDDRTTLTFTYAASDPSQTGSDGVPAAGVLRLWNKDGDATRNPGSLAAEAGDFISSGVEISAKEFHWTAVAGTNRHQATIYLEAVRPTVAADDGKISVVVNGTLPGDLCDQVYVTAVLPVVPNYSSGDGSGLQVASGAAGGDPGADGYSGAVRLTDGTVHVTNTDFTTSGYGLPWGQSRVWSDAAVPGSDAVNGNGWVDSQFPQLIQGTNCIIAVIGSDTLYFDQQSVGVYAARFFANEALTYTGGQYVLTDTVGDQFFFNEFTVANAADPTQGMYQRGGLAKYVAADGVTAMVNGHTALGNINQISIGGDQYVYTYNTPAAGQVDETLKSVQVQRTAGGNTSTVYQVDYTYYAAGNAHGGKDDLQSAVVQQVGANGLVIVDGSYYRYQVMVGGMDLLTDVVTGGQFGAAVAATSKPGNGASNAAQMVAGLDGAAFNGAAYDTQAFSYRNGQAVTQTIAGAGTYRYAYDGAAGTRGDGVNIWKYKTTVAAPGATWMSGSTVTCYLNSYGAVVLSACKDGARDVVNPALSGKQWRTYNQFDAQGRVVLTAQPAALAGITLQESTPGLIDITQATTGLMAGTDYYGAGATAPDYVEDTYLENGYSGDHVLQSYLQYTAQNVGTETIFPVSDSAVFANGTANVQDPSAQTTHFDYVFASGAQVTSITATLPAVSDERAGKGGSDQIVTTYDKGRVATVVAGGFTTTYGYDDATGTLTQTVQQVSQPVGGGAAATIMTSSTVDALGRTLTVRDGNATSAATPYTSATVVYIDGLLSSTVQSTPVLGPITVVRTDTTATGSTVATFTVANSGNSGSGSTGVVAGSAALLSLQITVLDLGGRTTATYRYGDVGNLTVSGLAAALAQGNIPAQAGAGTYGTTYGYDTAGRPNYVQDAVGTITRTVYDGLGRVASTWIGTSDTHATATDPTGNHAAGNNMTKVSFTVYDYNSVGDGDLTQVTLIPGNNAAGQAMANRVRTNYYDWSDHLVATDNGISTTYNTLDNLGQVTDTSVYDDGVDTMLGTATDGVPDAPADTALRAETGTTYDARGRAEQTRTHNIAQQDDSSDPSNVIHAGDDLGSLLTTLTYDARDNVVETDAPGGLVTKAVYDGAGRITDVTQGSANVVLSDVATQYDANGNAIFTTDTETGPAGNRTSYVANYYDAANRLTDTVNFGTNGGTALASRPALVYNTQADGTRPGWSPDPNGNDAYLLTSYRYDGAGNLAFTTDPRAIISKQTYDALGRVTSRSDGLGGPTASSVAASITNYVYDGMNHTTLVSVTAPTPGGVNQQAQFTRYIYGGAGISNDFLRTVTYYSLSGGTNTASETYTEDNLGEVIAKQDRSGVTHTYTYDAIGRLESDTASGFPANIDSTIQEISYQYDVFGHITLATSWTAGPNNSLVAANQVRQTYNGYGQLLSQCTFGQYRASATDTTPTSFNWTVGYNYESSNNHSRLSGLVYPDNTAITYSYAAGIDSDIGRISSVNDSSGAALEGYSYLGLGTVVGRTETLTAASGATPAVTASLTTNLDRFGRVQDQIWTGTGTLQRWLDARTYTYDADSNVIMALNLLTNPGSNVLLAQSSTATVGMDEIYSSNLNGVLSGAYNNQNEPTEFARGVVSGTALSSGSTFDDTYAWDGMGTLVSATDKLATPPVTTVVATGSTSGNSTDWSGVTTPTATNLLVTYDAWGRAVKTSGTKAGDATTTQTTRNVYDALGRVIREYSVSSSTYNGTFAPVTVTTEVDITMMYSRDGHLLQEAQHDAGGNAAPDVTEEFVWSASGNTLIVRDARPANAPNTHQRLFALQDGSGNVTALVGYQTLAGQSSAAWQVVERYSYDPMGNVQVRDPITWVVGATPLPTGAGATVLPAQQTIDQAVGSNYNWEEFFLGLRLDALSGTSILPGAKQFNTRSDMMLQPDYSQYDTGNPYVANRGIVDTVLYGSYRTAQWEYQTAMQYGGKALQGLGGVAATIGMATGQAELAYAGAGAMYLGSAWEAAYAAANGGSFDDIRWQVAGDLAMTESMFILPEIGTGEGAIESLAKNASEAPEALAALEAMGESAETRAASLLVEPDTPGAITGLKQLPSCFVAGTQVVVNSGDVLHGAWETENIENVKVGDWVETRDQNNPGAPLERKQVTAVFVHTVYSLRVLTIRGADGKDEVIKTTDSHPFYVEGIGWVAAGDLKAGFRLEDADGNSATVIATTSESHPEGVLVYNFTVDEDHTYFVLNAGDDPIWVHNTCAFEDLSRSFADADYAWRTLRATFVAKYGEQFMAGMEAHHLIPLQLLKDPQILNILREAAQDPEPFWFNGLENGLAIEEQLGPHPGYTAFVREQILRNYTGTPGGTADLLRFLTDEFKGYFDPTEL